MNTLPYPSYPDPCGWNALLPQRQPKAAARGALAARYAIVGAGFTGVAVARRLAELDPGAAIIMLEATTVGEGSSARNSGFISPTDIADGLSPAEIEHNAAVNRYGTEGFEWLVALIEQHGIRCDLQKSGRLKGAATPDGEAAVQNLLAIVRGLGLPHVQLGRDQMRERIGTAYYGSGVFTEGGFLVQPAALIRGLADALPAGVQLYENSPVQRLERSGKWRLHTADATVTADTVIMATNAAIKKFGYLRDRVVTIYTYAAISRPVPAADIGCLGSMATWGLLPSHRLGSTVRRVGNDRVLVRSLYSYERALSSEWARRELTKRFHMRYPDLAHVDLDTCWGGTTGLTMNGQPFWGRVDDRLYTFAGCNGAGVVKGTVLGKRLAEQIMGQDVAAEVKRIYGTAKWVAPEPFRSIGFRVVSAIERRKAGLES